MVLQNTGVSGKDFFFFFILTEAIVSPLLLYFLNPAFLISYGNMSCRAFKNATDDFCQQS